MVKYNPDMERTEAKYSYKEVGPNGVSEAQEEKNEGWGHRSQIARNQAQKAKEKSVTAEVREKRHGKAHRNVEEQETRHENEQDERPKSDNSGVTDPSDYEHGRPLNEKERAAKKWGHYWTAEQKVEFLQGTDLTAEDYGWI